MSYKLTRVKPHTPTSYLMMPNKSMALTMINSVGWVVGKFKDSGYALSSTPSSHDSYYRAVHKLLYAFLIPPKNVYKKSSLTDFS